MGPEVRRAEELPAADRALVRLQSGVDLQVVLEIPDGVERLPALGAGELFLLRVRVQMLLQVVEQLESLSARVADVWALVLVCQVVPLEVALLEEALSTDAAQVRLLPGVRQHVRAHIRLAPERALAYRAGVRTLAGVRPCVTAQMRGVHEELPALTALVCGGRHVRVHRHLVPAQLARRPERLPTYGARLFLRAVELPMRVERSAHLERLSADLARMRVSRLVDGTVLSEEPLVSEHPVARSAWIARRG